MALFLSKFWKFFLPWRGGDPLSTPLPLGGFAAQAHIVCASPLGRSRPRGEVWRGGLPLFTVGKIFKICSKTYWFKGCKIPCIQRIVSDFVTAHFDAGGLKIQLVKPDGTVPKCPIFFGICFLAAVSPGKDVTLQTSHVLHVNNVCLLGKVYSGQNDKRVQQKLCWLSSRVVDPCSSCSITVL